ncbi:hypothetical protein AIOL_001329 [Candidatus Rhodobacter oscarellae]|uniref:Uncharacterized protein n=1 Tax=Candidatus Rhodobacter oscarellae TaxID=1675527 RepID=A0A0J9E120_9RHOB|nr:hypothetical protein [Candidatus Rhodobacter lobularis]KMW56377.1 hypothetical protein AIOL_001329 [Candidatus Rhodobacter lobularis]
MSIPGVSGQSIDSISTSLASEVNFAQFADTLHSAAEMQMAFAERSSVTNTVIAEAQNIKDAFNKLR